MSDTIKLFDFDSGDFKSSFIENEDQSVALEQPKFYLNVVYDDKVVGPLTPEKTLANPKDDSTWNIIPIAFTSNKERWSGSGMKCIHIDAHVNTCIMTMFKSGPKKIGALTNYIIERF